jgi:hypothetical protein
LLISFLTERRRRLDDDDVGRIDDAGSARRRRRRQSPDPRLSRLYRFDGVCVSAYTIGFLISEPKLFTHRAELHHSLFVMGSRLSTKTKQTSARAAESAAAASAVAAKAIKEVAADNAAHVALKAAKDSMSWFVRAVVQDASLTRLTEFTVVDAIEHAPIGSTCSVDVSSVFHLRLSLVIPGELATSSLDSYQGDNITSIGHIGNLVKSRLMHIGYTHTFDDVFTRTSMPTTPTNTTGDASVTAPPTYDDSAAAAAAAVTKPPDAVSV